MMENNGGIKYTLFDDKGRLQAKLYDSDRDQSPPKPQSARGDRGSSSQSKRIRPTSAQSARASSANGKSRRHLSPNERESRSVGGAVAGSRKREGGTDEAYYQLEREDLLNTCLELKKNQRVTEADIARLKYENQRLETENLKAQRRIEKLISPQITKNGQTTSEIRRDIEKTAIVRQLKGQTNELRELLLSKDKLLDTMQKSQKASQLLELMAEKEEYFSEVQRLRTSLQSRDEEIQRLRGRGASSNYRGASIEDELRTEINRLSVGYNELLVRLAQSEKERQLERIEQEEETMRHEARSPDDPGPSKGGKRAGGRNQVKKTYQQPQPVPIKNPKSKRPSSASSTGRNGRGRSRDASPGNMRRPDEDIIDQTANDEWLSMTFGSGSVEPLPAAAPNVPSRGESNVSPSKESGRPVTSRRGDPRSNDGERSTQGTLSALNFSVGDRVSVRHSDRTGSVKAIDLLDMICDITFEGGEELRGVPAADVTLVSPRRKNRVPKDAPPAIMADPEPLKNLIVLFKTSDKVNLVMTNSKRPGTVIKHHLVENIYDVMLDKGGEIVYNIPAKCLELRAKTSPKKSNAKAESLLPPLLIVGTPVNARYKGSDYWYPGSIREIEVGANSYVIHFDDGEIVTGVPADHVDKRDVASTQDMATNGLTINTPVEANYLGKGNWYPGRISMSRGSDKYDVAYDDGEHEVGISLDRLRIGGIALAPPPQEQAPPPQQQFPPTSELFVHNITTPSKNSSDSIEHVGGKHESPEPSTKPISPRRAQPYSDGDDVEIDSFGDWKPGKISRIYLQGYEVVYDVVHDDGSHSDSVGHHHIRHRDGGKNGCSHYFTVESQVEAFDANLTSWRLGTIKKLNFNGSYNITFTNGEEQSNILPAYVRVLTEDIGTDAASDGKAVTPENPVVAAVQKPIQTVHHQPVQDIDDTVAAPDDDAAGTPREEVKLTADTTPLPTGPPPLVKGSKVEANYRCQDKWYPGEIIRENADDTVDIDYDDGERETKVKRENVRHLVPKDDLMDYLAGLSDEDDDDEGALDYGIGGGGVVYETVEPAVQRQHSGEAGGSEDDYAEDFD